MFRLELAEENKFPARRLAFLGPSLAVALRGRYNKVDFEGLPLLNGS